MYHNIGACADLVSIGDNTVTGSDCILAVSAVEGGVLKLHVEYQSGQDVHIGSQCVLDGHSVVEEAAELGSLSMVPLVACVTIPSGEKWIGSPARFDSHIPPLASMKHADWMRKSLLMLA